MSRRGLPLGPPPSHLLDPALAPEPPEAPFLRRRVQTRARPRRRGWSARLVVVLQVAAVLILVGGGAWTGYQRVLASQRLQVERVEVRGSHFLSEGEVRELIGPAVGENILSLDLPALKARLRSSPWVADATVTRTLPNTVRVEVHERVPLALAEIDRLYLMDGDGALVDIYGPRTGVFDLPIVRGLLGVDADSRRARARRAGILLADLAELAQEVSEVFVEPSGDLRVVLRGPGEVLLFGDPPYRERFVTFLRLRRELAEKAPGAEHFDLRFRGRIYAKRPSAMVATAEADSPGAGPREDVVAPPAATPPVPGDEVLRPVPSPWGRPAGSATTSLPETRGVSLTVPTVTHESRRTASGPGVIRR
jgi:cell division protein FtsQ